MINIFLTGDNHIGLKYAGHSASAVLCEKRIAAFDSMVDAANREQCDLFVIAGDLFENTYSIAKREIVALFQTLSRFRGTVVILPGNHDYYDKETKLWQYVRDVVAAYDTILLLTEYAPYTVTCGDDTVILYPALCTTLHSAPGKNNLEWIKHEPIVPDGTYRLGIAHGAVEGETIDNEGAYFLMTRDELEAIPVDAWLIGHTHVPFPRDLKDDGFTVGERIFNAGTHVQTDVACRTEGQCMIIRINEDRTVRAKAFASGNVRFYRQRLTVAAGELETTLASALRDIDDEAVVDLVLSGAVNADEYHDRHRLLDEALSRFIEGTYSDHALNRLITKDLIDAEFPETSFCAGLLTALLDDPKEAQLAYELLKTLKEGQ